MLKCFIKSVLYTNFYKIKYYYLFPKLKLQSSSKQLTHEPFSDRVDIVNSLDLIIL